MYCHDCGIEINDNDKFCFNCGTKILVKSDNDTRSKDACTEIKPEKVNEKPYKDLPVVNIVYRDKFVLIGFILSFFLVLGSIPSIIFCVLGMKRSTGKDKSNKSLAVSGIVISGFTLIMFIVYLIRYISANVGSGSGIV